jgi:VanZ family protein
MSNARKFVSIDVSKSKQIRDKLLGLTFLGILAVILVAGLWPFHAPRNQVHWLRGGGLWFGRHGTVLSAGPFNVSSTRTGSYAVEIRLTPSVTWQRRTILAFYAPNRSIPFSLHQSNKDLVLESQRENAKPSGAAASLYVNQVFRADREVFISITSDGNRTAVYLNGEQAEESQRFAFSGRDLRGALVLANSPVINDSWSGIIRGLAVYNHFLTPTVARGHYQSWTGRGHPTLTGSPQPTALYFFDQAAGWIVSNQEGGEPNLLIPKQYTVLHQAFLQRPWDEYKPDVSYWKSVIINVGGFIPLGCVLCAYLRLVHRSRRAALITTLLGAAVSITIEVLQGFLPTRDSGITDIFTNTLGTAVGAEFYRAILFACENLGRSRHAQVREVARWLLEGADS